MTKHLARERSHLCENERMRRACGASANDLRRNRQVKAYDTVLEETDSIPAKHFSHNAPESKEQERSRPLRKLRVMQRPGHRNFDGDMQGSSGVPDSQLCRKFLLPTINNVCRMVAYQNYAILCGSQLQARSGK
jgi:hypothetical protein